MSDRFTLSGFEFFVLQTRTRFPFRYGIASMTEVPHLFARTRINMGVNSSFGLTSEGLPPKWFTKDTTTTFEQDLPLMLEVIRHAARLAQEIAQKPIMFFDFWNELYREQSQWAKSRTIPPLLAQLGVSLVERAVLDGLCRLAGKALNQLFATDRLGLDLGQVHPELGKAQPRDYLPVTPLETCFVRHTIGLGDAFGPNDIPSSERVADGLPQDLEASIRAYGLRFFKVKLHGVVEKDFPRLRALARLLDREAAADFLVTLDGNENFRDFGVFRQFWDQAACEPELREFWKHIIIVEQPVHRDSALSESAGTMLRAWPQRPALIIDESDGAVEDVPRALKLGYAGASHKNCKGIVKGLANACLLAKRRREGHSAVLTGEDLCNLGPVALLQDLAMMSLLGIEHVERNGHHYYRGLSMFPRDWQEAAMEEHGDLYGRHSENFPAVKIMGGKLRLGSVNAAPFGVRPLFDPSRFASI